MVPALVPLVLLAFASPLLAQSSVSGQVWVVSGAEPKPLSGAMVVASGGDPRRPRSYAETNGRGFYQIDGLSAGAWSFSVEDPLYFAVRSGGAEADEVVRTCPATGVCSAGLDFEVARSSVIEGWVTDEIGEPLSGVIAVLARGSAEEVYHPGLAAFPKDSVARDTSDDEGYFRLHGLKPGRYRVVFRSQTVSSDRDTVRVDPVPMEIVRGKDPPPLHVAAETPRFFRFAGEVAGFPGSLSGYAVRVSPKLPAGATSYAMLYRRDEIENGRFDLGTLAAGEYVVTVVKNDDPFGRDEEHVLGVVDLNRDMTGATLVRRSTSLGVKVEWEASFPEEVRLRLEPTTNEGSLVNVQLSQQEPAQEVESILPGRYRLRSLSDDVYVISPRETTVAEGSREAITVQLGTDWSTLRGRLRLREGETASNFRVALRGPDGVVSAQADDQGRFVFDQIKPGRYELGAWRDARVDLDSEQTWSGARETVRVLDLEPGFEVEVEVTVTP